jgi:3-dehydroquinate dehydratase-2
MKKVLVLHGPNLNLLGLREPSLYGIKTLKAINSELAQQAQRHDISLITKQSQMEGTLIEAVHEAYMEKIDYIILNPAAYTHTSIALRDALLAVQIPFIEVHLSNVYKREKFRQHSCFSDIAAGVIQGFGVYGYVLALEAVIRELTL